MKTSLTDNDVKVDLAGIVDSVCFDLTHFPHNFEVGLTSQHLKHRVRDYTIFTGDSHLAIEYVLIKGEDEEKLKAAIKVREELLEQEAYARQVKVLAKKFPKYII